MENQLIYRVLLYLEDPFDQQERKKCPNRNPPAIVMKHIAQCNPGKQDLGAHPQVSSETFLWEKTDFANAKPQLWAAAVRSPSTVPLAFRRATGLPACASFAFAVLLPSSSAVPPDRSSL